MSLGQSLCFEASERRFPDVGGRRSKAGARCVQGSIRTVGQNAVHDAVVFVCLFGRGLNVKHPSAAEHHGNLQSNEGFEKEYQPFESLSHESLGLLPTQWALNNAWWSSVWR